MIRLIRILLEPIRLCAALDGVHAAVHVAALDLQIVRLVVVRQILQVLLDQGDSCETHLLVLMSLAKATARAHGR